MNLMFGSTVVIFIVAFIIEDVLSLRCWHCIAENCQDDPTDNYKASERDCQPGQACQKVYFEMYSETDQKGYRSTVRGCSTACQPRNDFMNCTRELKTTRGCIRKDCCHDSDLCNHSNVMTSSSYFALTCLTLLIYIFTSRVFDKSVVW